MGGEVDGWSGLGVLEYTLQGLASQGFAFGDAIDLLGEHELLGVGCVAGEEEGVLLVLHDNGEMAEGVARRWDEVYVGCSGQGVAGGKGATWLGSEVD